MPRPSRILLQPGDRLLIRRVTSLLRGLDAAIPEAEDVPGPPSWMASVPEVHYTPTSTAAHPVLETQLALATIATVSPSVPVLRFLCTDGPVRQMDGQGVVSSLTWMLRLEAVCRHLLSSDDLDNYAVVDAETPHSPHCHTHTVHCA